MRLIIGAHTLICLCCFCIRITCNILFFTLCMLLVKIIAVADCSCITSACADAYLTPCIKRYLTSFTAGFANLQVQVLMFHNYESMLSHIQCSNTVDLVSGSVFSLWIIKSGHGGLQEVCYRKPSVWWIYQYQLWTTKVLESCRIIANGFGI